jgi:hypothetical protein
MLKCSSTAAAVRLRVREMALGARERRFRCEPLAGRSGTGKQGLDLAQSRMQLLLARHYSLPLRLTEG